MKKCSKCECDLHEFSQSKKSGICRACYSAIFRNRYQVKEHRDKQKARIKAGHYQRIGILLKQDCSLCGSSDTEMHHPDYSKPTYVSWMCKKCHSEFHALERRVFCA